MKNTLLFIAVTLMSLSLQALPTDPIRIAETRCAPESASEPKLYRPDTMPGAEGWFFDQTEMKTRYEQIYSSGKRLTNRAFYRDNAFYIPSAWGEIKLGEQAILAIISHVEEALRLAYAEYPYFPDMGHAHFHIPNDFWDQVADLPADQRLSKIINNPKVKALYHTAEQLRIQDEDQQLPEDKHLQWRYWTRNIVGDMSPGRQLEIHRHIDGDDYNTVRTVEGHRNGWGFDLSASRDGCFPFQFNGKTMYFDINLEGLQYPEGEGSGSH